jgi:hypothetical protein
MLNEAIDGLFRRFSYGVQKYKVFKGLSKKKSHSLEWLFFVSGDDYYFFSNFA